MTSNHRAILKQVLATCDSTGNLLPPPDNDPDGMAPVVRQAEDHERELRMVRWGMPAPEQYDGHPVTNIRNTDSPHWRRRLTPRHRCLVPLTSFSE
jgi:putative SOS response-associated peptidase YedK